MTTEKTVKPAKVLVIDVGGTNVKILATGQKEPRKFPSGPSMTAQKMVQVVKNAGRDWRKQGEPLAKFIERGEFSLCSRGGAAGAQAGAGLSCVTRSI